MFGVTLEAMAGDKRGVEQAWESVEADVEVARQMLLRGREGPRGGRSSRARRPGMRILCLWLFLTWYERGDRVAWERVVGGGDGEIRRFVGCMLAVD